MCNNKNIENKCKHKKTSYCYLCSRNEWPYDLDDRFEDNFEEIKKESNVNE